MSSKVVEANAGIHSLAMAVAVRPSISFCCTSCSLMIVLSSACHQLETVR